VDRPTSDQLCTVGCIHGPGCDQLGPNREMTGVVMGRSFRNANHPVTIIGTRIRLTR
jgi:hypothetical protein